MSKQNLQKGIVGLEYALTSHYVCSKELAKVMGEEPEKYTIGLGIEQMGVVTENEDIISLAMNAVNNLIKKYKINPNDVGRIDVGTESNFDISKSAKTYLMDLFPENTTISGADHTNACYSGTAALLSAMSWVESRFWDGRYAIVVTADISYHTHRPAVPTSGACAVAILLGINPSFILESNMYHFSVNEYSFMKPVDIYPYCIMEPLETLKHYNKAFESCYKQYLDSKNEDFDYICFHTPFPKLPAKVLRTAGIDTKKVTNSLEGPKRNANSYSSSLYFSLISLLTHKIQINEKIAMFSFGSGCVSTLFILKKVKEESTIDNLTTRLDNRVKMDPNFYIEMISDLKIVKNAKYGVGSVTDEFYLSEISEYRRSYKRKSQD